jgi:hypothetical protein
MIIAVAPIVVRLTAQNDSHEIGTAIVSAAGRTARITISVTGEPRKATQPARIHVGTCDAVAQTDYILNNVRDGHSQTILAVSLTTLETRTYVIVLEDSPMSLHAAKEYKYVSCGPIHR